MEDVIELAEGFLRTLRHADVTHSSVAKGLRVFRHCNYLPGQLLGPLRDRYNLAAGTRHPAECRRRHLPVAPG